MSSFKSGPCTPLPDAKPNARPDVTPCGPCSVRHLALCGAVPIEELHCLAEKVSVLHFAAKQSIFDEGAPARHVYVVTAGTIKIYKLLPNGRRQVTGFLFPSDFLGFAHDDLYAYGAEAIEEVTLCRFRKEDLERLLERFPDMEMRLMNIANHELAAAQDQMVLLGSKTAMEKVSSFLLMLSMRTESNGDATNPVKVPMTRADIADYLCLTTETVSRTFSKLKQGGLIADHLDNCITIVAPEALDEIAEGY